MNKKTIPYKGVKVLFRDMKYLHEASAKCPICSKHIYKGDAIYSIMNNYVLFPSVPVHKECVRSKEECVKYLVANYTKFKNFIKRNEFWYNEQCP